jgi:hypothetical protein
LVAANLPCHELLVCPNVFFPVIFLAKECLIKNGKNNYCTKIIGVGAIFFFDKLPS